MALVPESMRVSRNALLAWPAADRELPRLVRSLIAETEPSAEWLDMPAGTGVRRPGVDGVLDGLQPQAPDAQPDIDRPQRRPLHRSLGHVLKRGTGATRITSGRRQSQEMPAGSRQPKPRTSTTVNNAQATRLRLTTNSLRETR